MNIPGFDIISKIDEDSIASTWKAQQVSLDRPVLIKVLKDELKAHPQMLQALLNESRTASQLKTSNVVLIIDTGKHEGAFYFVTEYIEEDSAADRIKEKGRISTKEALVLASATATVLDYVHESTGIIHRNISPQKILIDSAGVIKISDIGLTAATGIFGEPANYFSPEQISGEELTVASDMYSLGCTIYHMITGIVPFEEYEDEDVRSYHQTHLLKNPRAMDPSISLGIVQLLERLMMKNPAERYSSWKEAAAEIDKVAAGRFLLQKSGSAGLSTISAQSAKPKSIKAPKQSYTPKAHAERPKPKPSSAPMSIQLPAWILLFVWWIILGYIRYPDTPPPPVRHQRPAHIARTTTTTVPRRVRRVNRPRPKPNPTTPSIKTDEEIMAEAEAAQKALTEQNPEYAKFNVFMKSIAFMLYSLDFKTASGLVKNELEYMQTPDVEEKLRDLSNLLDKFEPPMKLVEEGFSKKKGSIANIVYGGKSRKVKIKAVSNRRVVVTPPSSNKPITFEIKHLDPAECGRWIPPSSKPEINAIKHILFMNGEDYENAEKHAKMSGILSDFFIKHVKETKESKENSDTYY